MSSRGIVHLEQGSGLLALLVDISDSLRPLDRKAVQALDNLFSRLSYHHRQIWQSKSDENKVERRRGEGVAEAAGSFPSIECIPEGSVPSARTHG